MKSIFTIAGIFVCATAAALAAEIRVINSRAAHPEGPVFIDGRLYYAESGSHTINVWDGSSNIVFWRGDGCGPLAVLPLGPDLVVACNSNNTIARVARDGKTVATYDRDKDGGSLQGPNDFAADGKGGVYFTVSGPRETAPIIGKIFHMVEDGTITEVANDLHYPSGLVLGADGRLYVSESEAGRVISFAIRDDGTLTDRRQFVRLGVVDPAAGINAYPDGLKLGPDGNFYIGLYSQGRIVVVDKNGEFVRAIDVPSPAAPNVAFSPDGKMLYVTAIDDKVNAPYLGKIYEVPLQ
jgi:gluconolactonase